MAWVLDRKEKYHVLVVPFPGITEPYSALLTVSDIENFFDEAEIFDLNWNDGYFERVEYDHDTEEYRFVRVPEKK